NCQLDGMFFKDVHVIILGMGIFFYVHFQSLYMVEGKRASFHFVTRVREYYYFLSVSFALSLCRVSLMCSAILSNWDYSLYSINLNFEKRCNASSLQKIV